MRSGAGCRDAHAHQDADADFHAGPAHRNGGPADGDRDAHAHRGADRGTDRGPDCDARTADAGAHGRAADGHAPPRCGEAGAQARAADCARPSPPPAASDPCASIGGDGCKFRVTGGPSFGENGGQELKLQFMFQHGGIDGGQPQGSYFVVLEKDGQKLPISDSVRSIALDSSQGTLGKYNYEFSLGRG